MTRHQRPRLARGQCGSEVGVQLLQLVEVGGGIRVELLGALGGGGDQTSADPLDHLGEEHRINPHVGIASPREHLTIDLTHDAADGVIHGAQRPDFEQIDSRNALRELANGLLDLRLEIAAKVEDHGGVLQGGDPVRRRLGTMRRHTVRRQIDDFDAVAPDRGRRLGKRVEARGDDGALRLRGVGLAPAAARGKGERGEAEHRPEEQGEAARASVCVQGRHANVLQ